MVGKLPEKTGKPDNFNNGPGKGRPKGATNKVTRELKDMILGALEQNGGEDYLASAARTHTAAFLALLGRILPTEVKGDLTGGLAQAIKEARERRDARTSKRG